MANDEQLSEVLSVFARTMATDFLETAAQLEEVDALGPVPPGGS